MKPTEPEPVKLFVGILYTEETLLEKAMTLVVKKFGETDFESPVFEFKSSDYYKDETKFKKRIVHHIHIKTILGKCMGTETKMNHFTNKYNVVFSPKNYPCELFLYISYFFVS